MQRFEQSVACTIMTANSTNRHDNSVCPYFPYFPIFLFRLVAAVPPLAMFAPSPSATSKKG